MFYHWMQLSNILDNCILIQLMVFQNLLDMIVDRPDINAI